MFDTYYLIGTPIDNKRATFKRETRDKINVIKITGTA